MTEGKNQLVRGLGLTATTSLVIGTVIGTGVFLKTAVIAQLVGTPTLVLAAWVSAGLLSLAGALTYAELGAMLPKAGGEYVYLRTAYGSALSFLYGWTSFAVIMSGAIAALSVGFATFLSALLPISRVYAEHTFHLLGQEVHWEFGSRQIVAVAMIIFFSVINCLGVVVGGRVQSALTVLKLLALAGIVVGVFVLSGSASWEHFTTGGTLSPTGSQAFGAAMVAALWAYTGWTAMPMVAGEVRDPGRNIPRGLIFGMITVFIVYVSANLAYFYALPFSEIATSSSNAHINALPVATKAVRTFLGPMGTGLVSGAFAISVIGALNGTIMGGARIPYAMARDGLFFAHFGAVGRTVRVPVCTILVQAVWASLLALSGTFDQLTNYAIFSLWLFHGVTAASVFVLRRKMPNIARPYRTLGYPMIPLIFIAVAVWLVINTIRTNPIESAAGLTLIALGVPLYFYFKRLSQNRNDHL